ncbi:hypothetical protein MTR67_024358 [Solanum verrucosum]|uniref:NB-ARC domain-containing protein n=1 Tax=Solanum verrucosum TaxID=315347 RepID=A0AAF0QXB6_SOLVR|nr:hypothetical protein MTR67_024358 [Solanum verrucosum]
MEECTQKSRVIGLACEGKTEWIIRKLTNGPAEVDVISIVGMPRLGKTTLAYRVFNVLEVSIPVCNLKEKSTSAETNFATLDFLNNIPNT